jgi:hypothetical protein
MSKSHLLGTKLNIFTVNMYCHFETLPYVMKKNLLLLCMNMMNMKWVQRAGIGQIDSANRVRKAIVPACQRSMPCHAMPCRAMPCRAIVWRGAPFLLERTVCGGDCQNLSGSLSSGCGALSLTISSLLLPCLLPLAILLPCHCCLASTCLLPLVACLLPDLPPPSC